MANELVRKDSIEELCGHRSRALEFYMQARLNLLAARQAHARAMFGSGGSPSDIIKGAMDCYSLDNDLKYSGTVQRLVDVDMWRAFIHNTPLGSLMDAEERKRFEDSLKGDVPEATPENVEATMRRLSGEANTIFRRGLVNVFRKLSRDYASNDGFKVGERTVLTHIVVYEKNCDWMRVSYNRDDAIRDVDRVMHVLDGKPAPEYREGIAAALSASVNAYKSGGAMECETEYWRLRYFKNGNGHLFAKRKDLLERVNKLIAEHFGATVAAARGVAGKRYATPERREHFDPGWHPTPDMLVTRMLDMADIQPGESVLEPSAGTGAIARRIAALGADLTCIELSVERANELRGAVGHSGAKVLVGDFLDTDPELKFGRIVMNPPFGQHQDILHVFEAWLRLKSGGRLVAAMSPAVTFVNSIVANALRRAIQDHGFIVKLPSGTFKESGTSVEAILVQMDKPGSEAFADQIAT